MLKTLKSLKRFIFTYDWEVIEIEAAIFKIMWGFWFLLPFPFFSSIRGYTGVAPEDVWGFSLLALGSAHLWAISAHRKIFRKWATFLSFLFWLFSTILIWLQVPEGAIIPLLMVITIFVLFNFIRLSIRVKID